MSFAIFCALDKDDAAINIGGMLHTNVSKRESPKVFREETTIEETIFF